MKRGNSLVALLAVALIIVVLTVVFMKGNSLFSGGPASTRPDGKGTTVPGAVLARAKDAVCIEHLRDLRMSLKTAQINDPDEKWPSSLQETHQGEEFYKCPIGAEPYTYNPETGEVKCVHPGHEKY